MKVFNTKSKYNRGYTLVEVLISAAILVVTIAAVAVIISRGSKINREDMLRRRAFQVMEEVLERPDLSFKNYNNLLNTIGVGNTTITQDLPVDTLFFIEGSEPVLANVQRKMDIDLFTYPPTGAQIPVIRVTVIVSYEDKTESLSTIVTNVPLQ